MLRVFKTLWTPGELRTRGRALPRGASGSRRSPLRSRTPPIGVGGDSPGASRAWATLGDGWHATSKTPPQFAEALERLKAAAAKAGRRGFETIELSLRFTLSDDLLAKGPGAVGRSARRVSTSRPAARGPRVSPRRPQAHARDPRRGRQEHPARLRLDMAIRSDVVGSLLRPAYSWRRARRWRAGRAGRRRVQARRGPRGGRGGRLQESAGLDVVTDGEMRRYAFFGHLIDAVEGFDKLGGWAIPFRDEQGGELVFKRPVVVEKLRWRRSMCAEEFAYLRARATRPPRSRSSAPSRRRPTTTPSKSRGAYPTRDAYLADVVDVTRREVEELVRLGCTYIQIDAPQYAALLDPALREGYRQRGSDPDRLIDACIEMDNAAIGRHPGVTFGLHICRGNNQSKFYASGGYEPIAACSRGAASSASCSSTTTSARAASSRCARCPTTATVVLGLVTRRSRGWSRVDELRRRIDEAATRRPARAARAQPAVRLRVDHGRQSRHARGPATQAPARGGDRPRSVLGRLNDSSRGGDSMRLLALLVLAAARLWPLPAWAQSIKVGAVVPLTGRYGAGGAQVRAGYEIAVEQINAAGGVTVGGKKMPHRAGAPRRRVRRHQDGRAGWRRWPPRAWSPTSAASAPISTRRPPRWPRRTRSRISASPSRSTRSTSRGSAISSRRSGNRPTSASSTQGLLNADPGRGAAQDRGDLPGEDRLGPGDGRGVDRGRQGRRLPGGGAAASTRRARRTSPTSSSRPRRPMPTPCSRFPRRPTA